MQQKNRVTTRFLGFSNGPMERSKHIGVGVGIGIGVECAKADPVSDTDPDPDKSRPEPKIPIFYTRRIP